MGNYLITGVSSGLGLATAEKLLGGNHRVYGISRTENNLKELLKSDNFFFSSFDLSKIEEIETLFPFFKGDVKFDGLVHCAGVEETLPISQYKPDKILDLFRINVFSGIELLRNFLKKKYSNDSASVVLLSSVMGELGQPGKVGYCASKAAVLGVVKASAMEACKRKIRVNAVSPGVVNTPMTGKLFSMLSEDSIKQIAGMHPLGLGQPLDVASLISYLMSEESRWITGQNFIVDGGYSIH